MSSLYPAQTTISYLQWILDDLSVAQSYMPPAGTEEKNVASFIIAAIDRIDLAIRSYGAKADGSYIAIKAAILIADDSLQAARQELCKCADLGEVDYRLLVRKSSEALTYLKTSNGWTGAKSL